MEKYLYPFEKRNLAQRKKIAEALEAGKTYDQIKKQLGCSSSTISAVSNLLGKD